ncbi:NAD(P)-binding protein [Siminovitchia fortis]|uniref:precorrin-2 dehydrogenase n=1 Tax=Siminovitchia fortis TaxID=254758 RepID=A0A443IWK0_9BACI|nr:NAD(P)-binding protein [Siminovitchia fortis]RWR12540.1 NAD(P)-binding protein [Siminovitchia fortis]WHY81615.1 NAD(P)-binding protein [Siminovitchia fortis]
METYPVMLNLYGRKAVIAGGGKIAYRKTIGLLKAGAKITIISPDLYSEFNNLLESGQVEWKQKEVEANDLKGALIVIAATDNKSVNRKISGLVSPHQLVNVVDDSRLGNFHVPAKVTRGKLTIAVGTDGASPILAQKIRDEIADVYDESYRDYLLFLEKAREKIYTKKRHITLRGQLLKEITQKEYRTTENQQKFLERMNGKNGRAETKP